MGDGDRVTYPPRWTGKVFFNVSDSYPVNGLTSCEVVYEECGYELDYPVDMPDGVSVQEISCMSQLLGKW